MKVPKLEFKRIILRPLKTEDAPVFRKWMNDKEVTYNLIIQKALSLKKEIEWVKEQVRSKENYVWAIEVKADKKLIGNINLRHEKKNKIGHFGIVIGEKDYWGKGYAYEAFERIIQFAFEKLKCNRLELAVFAGNERAMKLYKKLGFVFEGRQRQKIYKLISNNFMDDEIYSILRQDWNK